MASSSSWLWDKITLVSSDGETLDVDASLVAKWKAIKIAANKSKTNTRVKPIKVKGVDRDILTKIIQYSEKHAQVEASSFDVDDSLKQWDTQFFKAMSLEEVNRVHLAARSVEYETLADASRKRMKEMLDTLSQGLYDAAKRVGRGNEKPVDERSGRLPSAVSVKVMLFEFLISFLLGWCFRSYLRRQQRTGDKE